MNSGVISKWISGIIGFIVLIMVVAALMPAMQVAGNNISNGNYFGSISSLFASGGIIFIILGAALIIVAVRYFMKHK